MIRYRPESKSRSLCFVVVVMDEYVRTHLAGVLGTRFALRRDPRGGIACAGVVCFEVEATVVNATRFLPMVGDSACNLQMST